MRIKVEPFLMKKGNMVAKAAVEFNSPETDGALYGFHLIGFTICEEGDRLFVLFPSSKIVKESGNKMFFFLKPNSDTALDKLEAAILDVYESMTSKHFNSPRLATGIVSPV